MLYPQTSSVYLSRCELLVTPMLLSMATSDHPFMHLDCSATLNPGLTRSPISVPLQSLPLVKSLSLPHRPSHRPTNHRSSSAIGYPERDMKLIFVIMTSLGDSALVTDFSQ